MKIPAFFFKDLKLKMGQNIHFIFKFKFSILKWLYKNQLPEISYFGN